MVENVPKPTALRIAASVILGVIVGGILFLILTFFIGIINEQYKSGIPINLQITENVVSLGLLILLIGFSIAYFWWKVETTPPSMAESQEIPESEIPDE